MRPTLATITLLLGLVTAGCGTTPGGTGGAPADPSDTPTSTSSGASTPTPPQEDPVPDPTPDPGQDPIRPQGPIGKPPAVATVSGVIERGVEQGCVLLDTGRETLLLLGTTVDPGLVGSGVRVLVTGTREPGLATTCQQGVPFRVSELRPFLR